MNPEHIQDPYLEWRLRQGQVHRVLRSINRADFSLPEVPPNKELPHPTFEGTIEEFGWSKQAVANLIHALEHKWIAITRVDPTHLRIELLPITELPAQLGHVSELATIQTNLKNSPVFGSPQPDVLTYLQTVDFAVEGYMDDETEGKKYGRVYVDSRQLANKRNVYLDPESLHVTDYEYGYSYCVLGGIPWEAIAQIDIIQAKKLPPTAQRQHLDTDDWPTDAAEAQQRINQHIAQLRDYLDQKLPH